MKTECIIYGYKHKKKKAKYIIRYFNTIEIKKASETNEKLLMKISIRRIILFLGLWVVGCGLWLGAIGNR